MSNVMPSKDPRKIMSSSPEDLTQELNEVNNKLNNAKGLDWIKYSVEKAKIMHKLSSTDFKTY